LGLTKLTIPSGDLERRRLQANILKYVELHPPPKEGIVKKVPSFN